MRACFLLNELYFCWEYQIVANLYTFLCFNRAKCRQYKTASIRICDGQGRAPVSTKSFRHLSILPLPQVRYGNFWSPRSARSTVSAIIVQWTCIGGTAVTCHKAVTCTKSERAASCWSNFLAPIRCIGRWKGWLVFKASLLSRCHASADVTLALNGSPRPSDRLTQRLHFVCKRLSRAARGMAGDLGQLAFSLCAGT